MNEFDLRRSIMEDECNIIHRRDMLLREFAGLFKMLNEEISEFEEFIELRRERRIKRGVKMGF